MIILRIEKWEVVEQSDDEQYAHLLKPSYQWDTRDYKVLYKDINYD